MRSALASIGAFTAAFVASSHHAIHMALLSLGVGGASLLFSPGVRRGMIVVSVLLTALAAWMLLRRPHASRAAQWGVAASIALSMGILAWSVTTHGF